MRLAVKSVAHTITGNACAVLSMFRGYRCVIVVISLWTIYFRGQGVVVTLLTGILRVIILCFPLYFLSRQSDEQKEQDSSSLSVSFRATTSVPDHGL